MWKRKKYISSVVLCLLLALLPCMCTAAERSATDQELTELQKTLIQLDNNLQMQEQNWNDLTKQVGVYKQLTSDLQSKLKNYEQLTDNLTRQSQDYQNLTMSLNESLKRANQKIIQAENSLNTVEKSFQEYKQKNHDRRWSLGVGISNHGTAYEIEFPINQNQNIGGWAYKDNVTSAGGLKLRF